MMQIGYKSDLGMSLVDYLKGGLDAEEEGVSDLSPIRPNFDRRLKLKLHGPRVTSNTGLLFYREFNEAVARYRDRLLRRHFQRDAAFALPGM
jgi:hypothetical protein